MGKAALKREEWDFSLCPVDQLEACYYYEFARESDMAKSSERVYREAIESAKDEHEARWLRKHRLIAVFNIFQSCPEFPDTPFLCIPPCERSARIEALWKTPALTQANLSSIIRTHEANFSQAKTLKFPTGFGEGDIAAFYINWGFPLPKLADDFREWLEKNKPSDANLGATNGAGSSIRQWQKWLKALGASRLLACMTWEEAVGHTSELRQNKHGKSWPLFGCNASTWRKAQRDAVTAKAKTERLIESLS